jgi:prolyl 4-hydroxylase
LNTIANNNIICTDHFLSAYTCNKIISELEFSYWNESTVYNYTYEGAISFKSDSRTSQTSFQDFFSDQLNSEIRKIENKLAAMLNIEVNNLEKWQATSYAKGGKFDLHYDCGHWKHEPSGEREKTILIYLNTPVLGGSTYFSKFDIEFKALKGRMLTWNNLDPDGECNFDMMHSGTPLIRGRKITLVTWLRQRKYRK